MKLVKKANGKSALKLSKKEWLSIGESNNWAKLAQTMGMDDGQQETGGFGAPAAGSGALESAEDPFANDDASLENSEVLDDTSSDLSTENHGEEPIQKIRRLVGELQSALDALDSEENAIESEHLEDNASLDEHSDLNETHDGMEAPSAEFPEDKVV